MDNNKPNTINTLIIDPITHVSDVIGQGCSAISNFIEDMFPTGFFKYKNISTSLVSVQGRLSSSNNTRILRRANPAISIKPNYIPGERVTESYLSAGNYSAGPGNNIISNERADMFSLLDNDAKDEIIFQYSRISINYDIGIRLGTTLEMWNVLKFLHDKLHNNRSFFLNDIKISVPIPDKIIYSLAKNNGYDLPSQTEEFLIFMRKYTKYDIYAVMDGGTNKTKFKFKITTNMMVILNSLPSGDTNLVGKSESRSLIQFQMETEFTFPSKFIYKTLHRLTTSDAIPDDDLSKAHIYLDVGLSNPRDFIDGKRKIVYQEFVCEINKPYEIIKFSPIIPKQLQELIEFKTAKGIPPEAYIVTKLFGRSFSLTPDEYYVDWTNKEILLESPLINVNYAIAMYVDTNEFYELQKSN